MTRFFLCTFAISSLLFVGCETDVPEVPKVPGSGKKTTSSREVADFSSLHMKTFGAVNVSFSADKSLDVVIDDNLVDIIETKVAGNKLTIEANKRFSSGIGPVVNIKTPVLTAAEFSGMGTLSIRGFAGDTLELKMSGAGAVTASGEVQSLTIEVSGTGNADLKKLKAKSANIKLTGPGNIFTSVQDTVNIESSGTGSIQIIGNPMDIKKKITGGGAVDIVPE
jgi:hypothetical protein